MRFLKAIPIPKKRYSSYLLEVTKSIPFSLTGTNDWQGRSSILEKSNGDWVLIFREGDSHTNNGTGRFYITFSQDKGRTWTAKNTYTDGSSITTFPISTITGATTIADATIIPCPNDDIVMITHERDTAAGLAAWKGIGLYRSVDGGKTWAFERELSAEMDGAANQIWAIYDYDVVNGAVYFTASDHQADLTTAGIKLYKTINNFVTVEKVSTVIANNGTYYESGIKFLSSSKIIVVLRSSNEAQAGQIISTNKGETWSAVSNITTETVAGVHQPRLKQFPGENRLYLVGRYNVTFGTNTKNGMWYSDDDGTTWTVYLPDSSNYGDSGYADCIKRDGNTLYMLGYEGTTDAARLYQYTITAS